MCTNGQLGQNLVRIFAMKTNWIAVGAVKILARGRLFLADLVRMMQLPAETNSSRGIAGFPLTANTWKNSTD
jgi:hypothetical protein